jgi:hypothetical protein
LAKHATTGCRIAHSLPDTIGGLLVSGEIRIAPEGIVKIVLDSII